MAQEEPGVAEFYSGLIAELYEPLAGGIGSSDRFIRFVRKGGEPALEVGCGTGLPMLDLLAAGLEVEGLDASADMLSQCRSRA
ncbi:MAG: class I SAM-dependent methyltransferase, partial [Pseudomonadales bacterium]|nr:class I SAM-dependent methyltransferase [Pseudomonadales bacterium]